MYYKGRKGGENMASTSTNKTQTVTVDNKSEDKAATPKLVVDNSIASDFIKETEKKVEKVKAAVQKKTAAKTDKPKKETVKKTVKKKATDDETTNVKGTSTSKTTTAKAANVKTSLVLQYQSIEVSQETLIQKVKDVWTNGHKKQEKDIKSIELYIKPEEYSAYYVINDNVKGRVDL
jgi:hypothetical protein